MLTRALRNTAALAAAMLVAGGATAQGVEISFYYPVAVGGPITRIVDGLAADFEKENPGIKVKPIYSGTYQESVVKALTAHKAGEPPVISVLLSTDMYTLIDEGAVIDWTSVATGAEDKAWMQSFYPAFMENSETGGKVWGIPCQRSTIVLYWNKEAFKEAGLDPNRAPQDWQELVDYAHKLTKRDASGNVSQWGIQVPSSGFPYWLFQAFTTQNNVVLMNKDGTRTYYDDPKVIEALQFWVDLSRKYKVMPPGIIEWGTTPKDFFERKIAMMWTTTGNLTNVRNNAKFDFGVAMLSAGKRRGTPTGGGNFYLFNKSTPQQQAAALKFVKWITSPERAAQWGIQTGYVATRPDAWETSEMKKYASEFAPATVARDQLRYAVAELSTHDNQRVTKVLNDGLQAALTGAKTPEQAMKDAQREAERLLRSYRRR